jgi:nuclear pore complex protein Nup155
MASTPSRFSSGLEDYWNDDFTPLQAAGQAVLHALREDEAAPDADLYRRITHSGSGSHLYFAAQSNGGGGGGGGGSSGGASSGASRASTSSGPTPPVVTMKHIRSVPLPKFLEEKLRTTKSHSLMGLLSPAKLAWMSVDHTVYLWSFHATETANGSTFCSFAVPSGQSVVAVGLVRPKKGANELVCLLHVVGDVVGGVCMLCMLCKLCIYAAFLYSYHMTGTLFFSCFYGY